MTLFLVHFGSFRNKLLGATRVTLSGSCIKPRNLTLVILGKASLLECERIILGCVPKAGMFG